MQYVVVVRNVLNKRRKLDLQVFGPFSSTANVMTWLRRVEFPNNYTWDIHELQSGLIEKGKRYDFWKASKTEDDES